MIRNLSEFQDKARNTYSLLPMRFSSLEGGKYVITNFSGEYVVLSRDQLCQFVHHLLDVRSEIYLDLKAKHFILDDDSTVAIDLLAAKFRTKKSFIAQSTSLFMFVTTLRCNHSCIYCQVTRKDDAEDGYDMTPEVAERSVEFMFHSPSPYVKVEFQGGESLLNFDVVKHTVLYAKELNQRHEKNLEFVITTNLSLLSDSVLEFCSQHDIYVSTSLDGPEDLHNSNRHFSNNNSYRSVCSGIDKVRHVLPSDHISALMTTTVDSLSKGKEIVDEYVRQGFTSIFLRILNPYGRAATNTVECQYSVDQWLEFYRRTLDYIFEINLSGTPFCEEYTGIILRKIITPFPTGYVDLQSPAGIGISGIILNYDGNVYASDESRMLAEMGDETFLQGNVLNNTYEEIMLSDALITPLSESIAECAPQCCDCAFLPYCGSDPVRHYRLQNDFVGNKAKSEFCKKNMGVIRHIISLLEKDGEEAMILRQWI